MMDGDPRQLPFFKEYDQHWMCRDKERMGEESNVVEFPQEKDDNWKRFLRLGIKQYYAQSQVLKSLDHSHIKDTADRLISVLEFNISGCWEDPTEPLLKDFAPGNYDEMIHERDIKIITTCAHHAERIVGKAHFSYIPRSKIVGLSKIPRMVDILCRRPQIQENLTEQIVDTFQKTVDPYGCGVHVRAYHFCMIARGIQEPMVVTETTAMRGSFKDGLTRQEFLSSLDHTGIVFP
jgi:GTP cyclohydrolase I